MPWSSPTPGTSPPPAAQRQFKATSPFPGNPRLRELLHVSLDGRRFVLYGFATRQVVGKWFIPGGGSPDMLQLNPAGTQLWASGRYNATVYVMSTTTGKLIAKIPVGSEDHGLTYFPNVGLHSLGHNGVYR